MKKLKAIPSSSIDSVRRRSQHAQRTRRGLHASLHVLAPSIGHRNYKFSLLWCISYTPLHGRGVEFSNRRGMRGGAPAAATPCAAGHGPRRVLRVPVHTRRSLAHCARYVTRTHHYACLCVCVGGVCMRTHAMNGVVRARIGVGFGACGCVVGATAQWRRSLARSPSPRAITATALHGITATLRCGNSHSNQQSWTMMILCRRMCANLVVTHIPSCFRTGGTARAGGARRVPTATCRRTLLPVSALAARVCMCMRVYWCMCVCAHVVVCVGVRDVCACQLSVWCCHPSVACDVIAARLFGSPKLTVSFSFTTLVGNNCMDACM